MMNEESLQHGGQNPMNGEATSEASTVSAETLDADLLEWFRQEKGYQTKINAILRAYMMAHVHSSPHDSTGTHPVTTNPT